MDVTKLELPEWLKSEQNCLFLIGGDCHHGANPIRKSSCRTYCPVASIKWLKSNYDHLDDAAIERYAILISELD